MGVWDIFNSSAGVSGGWELVIVLYGALQLQGALSHLATGVRVQIFLWRERMLT